jgi:dTDP-4-dehydrorhamnose 3,5-epimerase
MKKNETSIIGCYEIEFDRFEDDRGFFQELYSSEKYDIIPGQQISCSISNKNVIRGLHKSKYYKLCSCLNGILFDVVVDLREESSTYLKWQGFWLSKEDRKQILIPAGCGHGFYAAEDNTLLVYLQGGCYKKENESEIKYDDPKIGIIWPKSSNYIISEKDKNASYL